MSLINEALKRARQVQVENSAIPALEPPLLPVTREAPSRAPVAWMPLAAGFGILVLALFFLSLWWQGSKRETALEQNPAVAAADAAQAAVRLAATIEPNVSDSSPPTPVLPASENRVAVETFPAAPTVSGTSASPSLPNNASTPDPLAPSVEPSSNEASQAAPQAGPMPDLKLQGIFYRLQKASVLINGQALFVGDEIDGAKIVAIERQLVRLSFGGTTNVLKLR